MSEILPVDSAAPHSSAMEIHSETSELQDTITQEQSFPGWNVPAIVALNAFGAIAYKYGNDPELLPPELLTMEIGPFFPAGSLRHLIVASGFTLACELAITRITTIKRPKLGAFMVALIPSVGWEVHQKLDAGHFGFGDMTTAAVTGGIAVVTSTKNAPAEI